VDDDLGQLVRFLRAVRDARFRLDRFRYQLSLDAPETAPVPSNGRVTLGGQDGQPWLDPALPNTAEPTGSVIVTFGVSARRSDGKSVIWGVAASWKDEIFHVDATVELEDPDDEGTEDLYWSRKVAENVDDVVRLIGLAVSEVIALRDFVFD
jgi:hypothetical protein